MGAGWQVFGVLGWFREFPWDDRELTCGETERHKLGDGGGRESNRGKNGRTRNRNWEGQGQKMGQGERQMEEAEGALETDESRS